jgi:chemotaxis protein methyltransferase CheR
VTVVAELNPLGWSSPGFAMIARLATERAGLSFPENRHATAEAAMRRAMEHEGFADANAFAERLAADSVAFSAALSELTVGETYFSRDPAQWQLLRDTIAPTLRESHPDGRGVRAWSAGCATGEEAYTLAMVLRETGYVDASVIGTDLCENRLARASSGLYGKWSMRALDESTVHRLFDPVGRQFQLAPKHREGVRFQPLNLLTGAYGGPGDVLSGLDLILCRNVLIYLEPDAVAEVTRRLVAALRDGGWLMLAASDPTPSTELPLEVVLTDSGLLYRKCARPAVAPKIALSPEPKSLPARPSHLVAVKPGFARAARSTPPVVVHAERTGDSVDAAYRAADYARTIQLTEGMIAGGNEDPAVWILLARAHANRGEIPSASSVCARALRHHPFEAELHYLQGTLATASGRSREAVAAARRALYLDRSLTVAYIALGAALLRLGEDEAAGRALRSAERELMALTSDAPVQGSDGASAAELLAIVRAHHELLMEGTRVG